MAIYQYDTLAPNLHPEVYVAEDATVIGDVTLDRKFDRWLFRPPLHGSTDQ